MLGRRKEASTSTRKVLASLETIEETFAVGVQRQISVGFPSPRACLLWLADRAAKRPKSPPRVATKGNTVCPCYGATSSMSAWQSKHMMCTVFVARTELRQHGH